MLNDSDSLMCKQRQCLVVDTREIAGLAQRKVCAFCCRLIRILFRWNMQETQLKEDLRSV